MNGQLFKKSVEYPVFIEFLEKVCTREAKYYVFDLNAYKKGLYDGTIHEFLTYLKPFYHKAKQYYLCKTPLTYNATTTVIRQLLKNLVISFETKICYCKGDYIVHYIIYALE
jgi:hypothetical protein